MVGALGKVLVDIVIPFETGLAHPESTQVAEYVVGVEVAVTVIEDAVDSVDQVKAPVAQAVAFNVDEPLPQ